MVSFTKCLNVAIRPEWASNYINYATLKTLLQDLAIGNKKEYFGEPIMTSVSQDGAEERDEMCSALDDELFKVQVFSMRTKRKIQKMVLNFKQHMNSSNTKSSDYEMTRNFNQIMKELIEFHVFVGVNTIALYQLLIRYDSMARLLQWSQLGQWYIITRRGNSNGHLLDGLDRKHLLEMEDDLLHAGTKLLINDTHIQNIRSRLREMDSIIISAEEKLEKVVEIRGHNFTDNILGSLLSLLTAGSSVTHIINIRTVGIKLHSHIKFFAEWRINFIADTSENDMLPLSYKSSREEYDKMISKNRLKDMMSPSLILILFAQLFYMMNHYIVEPSSVQVCYLTNCSSAVDHV